jgi:tRNA-2-methylthio-N6-dimethylallyladenosine synthase
LNNPHFDGATFFIRTYGCQMNQHDAERLGGSLKACGATEASSMENADFVVFVTCCVRERADERLYGQVGSIKNLPVRSDSPYGKRYIAVGGCIGQRDGQSLIDRLNHVDIVFGTHNLPMLPQLFAHAIEYGGHQMSVVASEKEGASPFDLPLDRPHPWSAWLPITSGCNNFCSYCIVPYVRGREISRPIEDIISEAQTFVNEGTKEITLLGQNVNSYGRDLYGSPRFADVLDSVHATGIKRLRFATSHPKDLTDDVIARFGTLEHLMPALHLPVQSGSDRILEAMNRHYTNKQYRSIIEKVRKTCPSIAFSTDIIVGFPGETESDFQQTYDLVKQVGYQQVYTFIYSPRKGTVAAQMENTVPQDVIRDRFDRLVELVNDNVHAINHSWIGRTVEILVEGPSKKDPRMIVGHSPQNQTVHAKVPATASLRSLEGQIVSVHVSAAKTWYLIGEIV